MIFVNVNGWNACVKFVFIDQYVVFENPGPVAIAGVKLPAHNEFHDIWIQFFR